MNFFLIFIVPDDCSWSSEGFNIIFNGNSLFIWHEPVDRKNPLKKKLFEQWLSSRCLSRSKAHRWQARTLCVLSLTVKAPGAGGK